MTLTPPGPPPALPPTQPVGAHAGPGHQPAPQQAPVGWIRFTMQGNAMTSSMVTPSVLLNGYQVPASYGENAFPVPPGRWRVEAYAQWLRRFGHATLDVDVPEGQSVQVYYAAPLHQWSDGAMGFEKQPRKGKALGIGLPVGMLVLAFLIVFLSIAL